MTQKNVHETDDEVSNDYPFYTENSTNLIYEVQFFDDFCIVRPAAPAFYSAIEKMSLVDFSREFTEYSGNHEEIRNHIRGGDTVLL